MKFQVGECEGVPVGNLSNHAIFQYGTSWYRVVDRVGCNVEISNTEGFTVIVNLKLGSLREIHNSIHVEPLMSCKDTFIRLKKVPGKDLWQFLKNTNIGK